MRRRRLAFPALALLLAVTGAVLALYPRPAGTWYRWSGEITDLGVSEGLRRYCAVLRLEVIPGEMGGIGRRVSVYAGLNQNCSVISGSEVMTQDITFPSGKKTRRETVLEAPQKGNGCGYEIAISPKADRQVVTISFQFVEGMGREEVDFFGLLRYPKARRGIWGIWLPLNRAPLPFGVEDEKCQTDVIYVSKEALVL
ncbi:hypothetical protein [Pseudoflavonifractor sp. 524-17]|uniref:hypothetical protein n=1 Tax=Pseudoflavonifractor sp. 524-17 TaxID=2304577 RepID=UPI00137B2743|nr:hypothetical protein [Pseudoflavonifractor sp. 524-17]